MSAQEIRKESRWIRPLHVDKVCARARNCARHRRACGRTGNVEPDTESRNRNSIDDIDLAAMIFVRNDNLAIEPGLQGVAHRLQVGLHPARMRRVELADMKHPPPHLSLCRAGQAALEVFRFCSLSLR